jgi:hypothetical protein
VQVHFESAWGLKRDKGATDITFGRRTIVHSTTTGQQGFVGNKGYQLLLSQLKAQGDLVLHCLDMIPKCRSVDLSIEQCPPRNLGDLVKQHPVGQLGHDPPACRWQPDGTADFQPLSIDNHTCSLQYFLAATVDLDRAAVAGASAGP